MMLELCPLASGSSGNAALVTAGCTSLLIDAGISARRITRSLRELDENPASLGGILITHAHSDHISGLPVLLRQLSVPLYATEETCRQLLQRIPQAAELLHTIRPGEDHAFGDLSVRAFSTPHDAEGSVGYTFTDGVRKACLVTDLGHVTEPVREAVLGAHLAMVEANHDVDWLMHGPYPHYLKRRILSDCGHLSNEDGGQLCCDLVRSGAVRLILAHLSAQNNSPSHAIQAVRKVLSQNGITPDDDAALCVAPADRCGERWVV